MARLIAKTLRVISEGVKHPYALSPEVQLRAITEEIAMPLVRVPHNDIPERINKRGGARPPPLFLFIKLTNATPSQTP
jgi:hypothetical protein